MFKSNLLNVEYIADFLSSDHADDLMMQLSRLNYDKLQFHFNGKAFSPKRGVYKIGLKCDFGGNSPPIHPWTPFVDELREKVEQHTGHQYNEAVINLYEDGSSGIATHRDTETSLCQETGIACVSFGATRKIVFRRDGYEPRNLEPTHGSLYVMLPPTNQFWSHESPKDLNVKTPRISVTFRKHVETSSDLQKIIRRDDISSPSKLYTMSDGDWLEKCDRQEQSSQNFSKVGTVWKLNGDIVIFIQAKGTKQYIVIKNTRDNSQVLMIPKTWIEFSTTISNFNTQQQSVGFQVNNQLMCFGFNGYLKLQQCFYKSSQKNFVFSNNFVDLPYESIDYLKTIIAEINVNISELVV